MTRSPGKLYGLTLPSKVTCAGEARRLREKFVQDAVSLGKWIEFK